MISIVYVDSSKRMHEVICIRDNVPIGLVSDTGACISLLNAYNYERYFKTKCCQNQLI